MGSTIHVTQFFSAARSRRLFDECDMLMQELLHREELDSSVRDAAVSADASTGIVEVEVVADGSDEDDALQAAVSRIRAAVTTVVQLGEDDAGPLRERDRTSQLVCC